MTDLRQAAMQALEALCSAVEPKKGKVYAREFELIDCYAMHEQAITALREALKQPEPVAKLFGTLPVFDTPPAVQRTWVGLTDEEVAIASAEFDTRLKLAFHSGMYKAQIILRKKNDH